MGGCAKIAVDVDAQVTNNADCSVGLGTDSKLSARHIALVEVTYRLSIRRPLGITYYTLRIIGRCYELKIPKQGKDTINA